MKTRNGFISNSSTSSFVIVGFMVNKDELTMNVMQNIIIELNAKIEDPDDIDEDFFADVLYDQDIRFIDNSEMGGFDDGRIIIGSTITELDDSGGNPTEFHSISSLENNIKLIKNLAKHFANEPKVQLITGTRMS